MRKFRLRTRLVGLLGLTLLFFLATISLAVFTFVARTEQAAWVGRQQEATRNAIERVDSFITEVKLDLDTFSLMSGAPATLPPELVTQWLATHPTFLEVVLLDDQGTIIASGYTDQPLLSHQFTLRQANWYQQTKIRGEYISNLALAADDTPYVLVARATPTQGVVVARLRMTVLWEVIDAIRFGNTGRAYLLNEQGVVLAHNQRQFVLEQLNLSQRPEIAAMQAAPNWAGTYRNFEEVLVVGTAARVPTVNWLVVVELADSEARAVSEQALQWLGGGLLGVSIVLLIVAAQLLNTAIFHPLGQLHSATEKFGQGDWAYRVTLTTQDEIGELAQAFNTMARNLQERETLLTARSNELAAEVQEHQRTETALRDARDAAEAANRAKSTFLANMSHELRTPLTVVIGYGEMLAEGLQTEARKLLHVERILNSATHLLMVINDILDFSKIEAGKMGVAPNHFAVAALLQDVVNMTHPLLAKNANQLVLQTAPDLGQAYTDEVKVRQVLFNLLSNAAKFTQAGTITLKVSRQMRDTVACLYFEVQDTGIGMSPEQMETLFQAFKQADTSTTRKYGGTGLGLVISRRLCQLLGGDITALSTLGVGSTFIMHLPMEVNGHLPAPPNRDLASEV